MRFSLITRHSRRAGFSLVELLVVLAFIAVLAAIAIPHFTNITYRAHDATVKSDLRMAMSVEEQYYIHGGGYVAFVANQGEFADPPGFSPSMGVTVRGTLVGPGLRLVGTHAGASSPWCMNNMSGEIVPGDQC